MLPYIICDATIYMDNHIRIDVNKFHEMMGHSGVEKLQKQQKPQCFKWVE
jgi:hypothetical protein